MLRYHNLVEKKKRDQIFTFKQTIQVFVFTLFVKKNRNQQNIFIPREIIETGPNRVHCLKATQLIIA